MFRMAVITASPSSLALTTLDSRPLYEALAIHIGPPLGRTTTACTMTKAFPPSAVGTVMYLMSPNVYLCAIQFPRCLSPAGILLSREKMSSILASVVLAESN
ncbi:hypothetical protein RvY_11312 [Ramazzottius varieornatus]|uniref:Uncharacterized protein n=1 Tax=Ramazzottius varieornatus TaxID=947166 RepID=A0A1D1VPJ7_RAMVA|nr:hypothetical protein RvY_11312 [Ramazzottius varieornatus]